MSDISKYMRNYSWAEKRKTMVPIYMKVTNDKYQLPIAVAGSISELARILGRSTGTVLNGIKRGRSYIVVWVDKNELE